MERHGAPGEVRLTLPRPSTPTRTCPAPAPTPTPTPTPPIAPYHNPKPPPQPQPQPHPHPSLPIDSSTPPPTPTPTPTPAAARGLGANRGEARAAQLSVPTGRGTRRGHSTSPPLRRVRSRGESPRCPASLCCPGPDVPIRHSQPRHKDTPPSPAQLNPPAPPTPLPGGEVQRRVYVSAGYPQIIAQAQQQGPSVQEPHQADEREQVEGVGGGRGGGEGEGPRVPLPPATYYRRQSVIDTSTSPRKSEPTMISQVSCPPGRSLNHAQTQCENAPPPLTQSALTSAPPPGF